MSGHNKWSKIKNKKGAEDAKKGAIFGKLSKEIFQAAKNGGGDPDMNANLRTVLDKARAANMPKDNINRAIKKATDAGDTTNYDEITYEGYGPGGVAILIHALTDNKNRTDTNMHVIFSRNGGNQGSNGSVAYLFDRVGYLAIDREDLAVDEEAMFEQVLNAGAEDLKVSEEVFEIFCEPQDFNQVKDSLKEAGFEFAEASVIMEAKTKVALNDTDQSKLENLIDKFEDDDDVQEVFTNAE
ncbi:YebC/PmpR family DNA-binding transcriptional regulator [Facklamia hominis]|uniref:Probable transcriptional regulatory protein HMPREF9706_00095 n=1 Tax=Facklamia hominis CCUG 36813 TaxID=883111 RepID=K1LVA9_9LACT|nr:YebC/PmpR family DNA-binding transcriptional regulator [Facklamia hominis]EKB56112.1 YebC/PmpR family DNA-binding regulatory protein [Facklamia hominis CCUG 36813]WPJ90068.1 YebC/PmpR family DNA-binding transcriptional regulator [Facklamia hominis]